MGRHCVSTLSLIHQLINNRMLTDYSQTCEKHQVDGKIKEEVGTIQTEALK